MPETKYSARNYRITDLSDPKQQEIFGESQRIMQSSFNPSEVETAEEMAGFIAENPENYVYVVRTERIEGKETVVSVAVGERFGNRALFSYIATDKAHRQIGHARGALRRLARELNGDARAEGSIEKKGDRVTLLTEVEPYSSGLSENVEGSMDPVARLEAHRKLGAKKMGVYGKDGKFIELVYKAPDLDDARRAPVDFVPHLERRGKSSPRTVNEYLEFYKGVLDECYADNGGSLRGAGARAYKATVTALQMLGITGEMKVSYVSPTKGVPSELLAKATGREYSAPAR